MDNNQNNPNSPTPTWTPPDPNPVSPPNQGAPMPASTVPPASYPQPAPTWPAAPADPPPVPPPPEPAQPDATAAATSGMPDLSQNDSAVFPAQFNQPAPTFPPPSAAPAETPNISPAAFDASFSSTNTVPAPASNPIPQPTFETPPAPPPVTSLPVNPNPVNTTVPAGDDTDHAHQAPTVPDFLTNLGVTPAAPQTSDTNPLSSLANPEPGINDNKLTDLSQMSSGQAAPVSPVYTPPVAPTENTTPPTPPGIPEAVKQPHNGLHLSKPMIFAGVGLIVVGVAVAAYFMWSNGNKANSPQQTFSLPATQQAPLTNPPKPIVKSPSEVPSSTAAADQSTSSASAFDLLKNRKLATPSSSPTAP